jgi:hypothetical protein
MRNNSCEEKAIGMLRLRGRAKIPDLGVTRWAQRVNGRGDGS